MLLAILVRARRYKYLYFITCRLLFFHHNCKDCPKATMAEDFPDLVYVGEDWCFCGHLKESCNECCVDHRGSNNWGKVRSLLEKSGWPQSEIDRILDDELDVGSLYFSVSPCTCRYVWISSVHETTGATSVSHGFGCSSGSQSAQRTGNGVQRTRKDDLFDLLRFWCIFAAGHRAVGKALAVRSIPFFGATTA
jgi:hypothetical protein